MLKRLKLHRFRYVEPGTELTFTERFNVLLGRNGTGKTTLLDLISMVLRSDFSALKEEEFDIEYEFSHEHGTAVVRFTNNLKRLTGGGKGARPVSAPRRSGKSRHYVPHVVIDCHLDRVKNEKDYEIEVVGVNMRWRKRAATWEGEAVVDVFEEEFLGSLGEELSWTGHSGEAHAILSGLGQNGKCAYRFDESLETFESITAGDTGKTPKPCRAPPIKMGKRFEPAAGAMEGDVFRLRFVPWDYEPERPTPGQQSTIVNFPSTTALAKFPALAGIKSMSMSFEVEESWQETDGGPSDGLWWGFGRAELLFSGTRNAVYNQNALSYGQKRLLAFLYYLDASPRYVIADELVNGMHHEWIRACLDMIARRPAFLEPQAFLTSQNPLLLDYLPLESVEQIQNMFIQCRNELVDGESHISWSNLSAEDAAELFADYKVGIQPIGEILRARGLW